MISTKPMDIGKSNKEEEKKEGKTEGPTMCSISSEY